MCSVDGHTLQPVSCEWYDPRPFKECLWLKGFEATGPEDPRLFVWPGKGLFMMFGSTPAAIDTASSSAADAACQGQWIFQQYLVLLQPYKLPHIEGKAVVDPWMTGGLIRLDYVDGKQAAVHAAAQSAGSDGGGNNKQPSSAAAVEVKEKNWNPFIYRGRLLFSHVSAVGW